MLDYDEDVDDERASILESAHDDLDAAKLLTDYRRNSEELPSRRSESECPYCGKTSTFGIRGNRFNALIMCSCCGTIRKA
jgi:hypothetical protein